ncbi:MAG TPA: sigma-70 family RNA polymerase sigma factor [Tepidisphaeraceae bacterium]|nr:sigma-70 family RNA polymerase sigma factor [Tepidisphaeraceae bacterium]
MGDREVGQTVILQRLLDRIKAGDEIARDLLLEHTCERLRRLVRVQLRGFPRVKRWDQTDDVLNDVMMRMAAALKTVPLGAPREFFALCGTQIRRQLIDLKRRYDGPEGMGRHHRTDIGTGAGETSGCEVVEGTDDTYDPAQLALWTEFHEQVEKLPDEEREVFNLRWYEGMSVEETAEVLKISTRSVGRRWLDARIKLGRFLQGKSPAKP